MRKYFASAFLFVCVGYSVCIQSAFAQVTRNDGFVDVNKGLPNSFIQEIPFVPDGYKGSFYVEDEWCKGNIYLPDSGQITDVLLRYDLQAGRLEIQLPDGIRALDPAELTAFEWLDPTGLMRRFIQGNSFRYPEENPVHEIVELLADGKSLKLFLHYDLILREGNYNVQIDIGDRTPQWVKKEKLYFVVKDAAYPVPGKTRKWQMFFMGKSEIVDDYIRQNQLNPKNKADLTKIVNYYNTL
ncbi:MAG: hypothetical protein R3D00_18560 [Bacteroidia bacterium]